jgi:hypothetical protein
VGLPAAGHDAPAHGWVAGETLPAVRCTRPVLWSITHSCRRTYTAKATSTAGPRTPRRLPVAMHGMAFGQHYQRIDAAAVAEERTCCMASWAADPFNTTRLTAPTHTTKL